MKWKQGVTECSFGRCKSTWALRVAVQIAQTITMRELYKVHRWGKQWWMIDQNIALKERSYLTLIVFYRNTGRSCMDLRMARRTGTQWEPVALGNWTKSMSCKLGEVKWCCTSKGRETWVKLTARQTK